MLLDILGVVESATLGLGLDSNSRTEKWTLQVNSLLFGILSNTQLNLFRCLSIKLRSWFRSMPNVVETSGVESSS